MLILEEKTESATLSQLIREWWTKLWTWLRGQPRSEAQADTQDQDPPKSLIL